MRTKLEPAQATPFVVLRRFIQRRQAQEYCGLCACDACALRFEGVVGGRFKLIPRDARLLSDFQVTDAEWESLALPINLAFIFHSSRTNTITAMYPSPAGATESLLPLENSSALLAKHPALASLKPDVEALLVNRVGEGDVPLLFLFSGSIFYPASDGHLQVQRISWEKECVYRMPLAVWQKLMSQHYPNSAWLPLRRDVLDRLSAFKRDAGLATWEETIERLLPAVEVLEPTA